MRVPMLLNERHESGADKCHNARSVFFCDRLASATIMLSKIFKKNETPPVPTPTPAPKQPAEPTPAQIAAQLADKAAWESKLQAANGDDAALLAIAKQTLLIDIKQAAVEALTSEDALKRAEREFRDHDRRVHRAAKQRLEALVNRRVAAVSAAKLIETAAVLLHEPSIPANRLVELDRAWTALDQALLDDKQRTEYATLWTKLSSLTRERGESQLNAKRWLADAEPALLQMTNLCAEVTDGTKERGEFAAARASVVAVLATAPGAQANTSSNPHAVLIDAKLAELRQALELAAAIDAHLAFLEELQLPAPTVAAPQAEIADVNLDVVNTTIEVSRPKPPSPTSCWRALAPVSDARINALLDARFADWQTAKSDARHARSAETRQHAKDETRAAKQARSDALALTVTALVDKAEAALTAGHLGETTKYLTAIDDASHHAKGIMLEKLLHTRIEALQTETARLKGWQHWGGRRVRDDLVVEAEALAAASTAERIAIKQHGDAIENLRGRWKELDKLGGATSRPLWQRFDAALKTAYLPVAKHLAKLKAVRQENLAARSKLIDALDAVKLGVDVSNAPSVATADAVTGAATVRTDAAVSEVASAMSKTAAPAATAATTTPDWRLLARALENFQLEWRKLGPVEHTVPHKSQPALAARMKAAIARLDAPLSEARRVAQLAREKLIARANVLSADTKSRDVIAKVRELQGEWQAHAKTLPLLRQVENALWSQFKTATDQVFTQRDALHAARDSEFKTNQAARETLITRLASLTADTAATELKRTVADADAEWRKCGDAPRAEAAQLEAKFRAARDAAQKYLAGSAARGWHNICDALDAKMALCAEIESAAATENVSERWALLPTLPAVWEKTLSQRLGNAQHGTEPDSSTDAASEAMSERILQLESALDIESPPAFHAARRDLKLRAMKAAIEARQSVSISNADIERWIGEVIAQPLLDATSNARVSAIIKTIRNKPLR